LDESTVKNCETLLVTNCLSRSCATGSKRLRSSRHRNRAWLGLGSVIFRTPKITCRAYVRRSKCNTYRFADLGIAMGSGQESLFFLRFNNNSLWSGNQNKLSSTQKNELPRVDSPEGLFSNPCRVFGCRHFSALAVVQPFGTLATGLPRTPSFTSFARKSANGTMFCRTLASSRAAI